jgi:type III pantothenate kinase
MHNLVIDIGNTNSKVAIFEDKELIEFQSHQQITRTILKELIVKYQVDSSAVSSVGREAQTEGWIDMLHQETNYVEFSTAKTTGIENYYRSPDTLGLDRWAKVIAAYHCYRGTDCLIIDAGTCITYDTINVAGAYYGGSISPGLGMRFKALHQFTGRLPLIERHTEDLIPEGRDTETAIRSGVLKGALYEVEGFIAAQNQLRGVFAVLLTGGDAGFLLEQLKNSIFAPQIIHDPYLVLKGLNEVIVFEYVQKD